MGTISQILNLRTSIVVVVMAIAACTKPTVTIDSLSKELPAPSLKSGGVESVDFPDSQKFLQFSGSCDIRSQSLKVAFKLAGESLNYQYVPASTTYNSAIGSNATAVSTTTNNDINCSDGQFSFILSKEFIYNALGINTDAELQAKNVEAIYIAGETLLGLTKPLILGVKDGSGERVPTQIVLRKIKPVNAAPQYSCFEVTANLLDSNGLHAETKTAMAFQLKNSSDQPVSFYPSWNDCNTSNSSSLTSTVNISSNNSQGNIYIRSSSSSSETYRLVNTASSTNIDTANSSISISFKNTYDSSSVNRFVMFDWNFPYTYKSNECYPFKIEFKSYNSNIAINSNRTDINLSFSSDVAGVQFYSNSTCSTVLANPKITTATNYFTGYIKYSAAGTSNSFIKNVISVSATGTDTVNGTLNIDADKIYTYIDLTDKTVITKLNNFSETSLETNRCYMISTDLLNDHRTLLPASVATPIDYVLSGGANINLYSNGCYEGLINGSMTSSIAAGNYRKFIFAVPLSSGSSSFTTRINSAGSNITSNTLSLTINSGPVGIRQVYSPVLAIGSCTSIEFELYDSNSNAVAPKNQLLLQSISTGSASVNIYGDSSCSSVISAGSDILWPPDYSAGRYRLYFKATGSLSNHSFSLTPFNLAPAVISITTQ